MPSPSPSRKAEQLRYAESHEWVSLDEDGLATIGISSFAVAELTDLVFMALPAVGASVKAGEEFGEVESVKAVSSLNSPISGEIVEVHDSLPTQLEILNTDPYDQGWLIRVRPSDPQEVTSLMNYETYKQQCESH